MNCVEIDFNTLLSKCTVPSKMNCRLLHSKSRQFIMLGTVCINLFVVYLFKISALKLQNMIKLRILKHATLISKHPVQPNLGFNQV